MLLTVTRVGRAGLISLGIACWLARGDLQSRSARGLVAAMLFYNIAAVGILTTQREVIDLNGLLTFQSNPTLNFVLLGRPKAGDQLISGLRF
jgi:hypothetical protein